MKTKFLLSFTIISIILTSCKSTSYFQVYNTTPSNSLDKKDKLLVYEDDNCILSYNLWGEGGNIGFRFFNKTDKNIYLNLEQSFFILNGVSHNYYKNRVYTNSASSGSTRSKGASASKSVTGINLFDLLQTNKISASSSIGTLNSSGYSVSYKEEKIVCIPAKTSKIFSEYNINESLFRYCDLYKYPKSKQVRSKSFAKSESPLVFSNRISYAVDLPENLISVENEFYVSKITNYPENEIIELKYEEFCGEKSLSKKEYFIGVSPDKFYIEYSKGKDSWDH